VRFADWRVADQRYYVSDTSAFAALTGWRARVGLRTGLQRLYEWMAHAPAPADAPRGHVALAGGGA